MNGQDGPENHANHKLRSMCILGVSVVFSSKKNVHKNVKKLYAGGYAGVESWSLLYYLVQLVANTVRTVVILLHTDGVQLALITPCNARLRTVYTLQREFSKCMSI